MATLVYQDAEGKWRETATGNLLTPQPTQLTSLFGPSTPLAINGTGQITNGGVMNVVASEPKPLGVIDLGQCPIVAKDAETAAQAGQWVEDEAGRLLTIEPLPLSPADMDYVKETAEMRDRILEHYGLSPLLAVAKWSDVEKAIHAAQAAAFRNGAFPEEARRVGEPACDTPAIVRREEE